MTGGKRERSEFSVWNRPKTETGTDAQRGKLIGIPPREEGGYSTRIGRLGRAGLKPGTYTKNSAYGGAGEPL